MRSINIIGLTESINDVVTVLGESGVFHPDDVSAFYSDIKHFSHFQNKNIYADLLAEFKESINLTKKTFPLNHIEGYNPTYKELESFVFEFEKQVKSLIDDRDFIADQIRETKASLDETVHFLGLDVETEKLIELSYVKPRFGKLPKESMQKLGAYKDNPYVNFISCTEDKSYYWGVYFTLPENGEEIDRIFSGLHFEKYEILGVHDTPKAHLRKLEDLIPLLESKLRESEKKLNNFIEINNSDISKNLSKLEELCLYSKIKSKALKNNDKFIIVGWVPAKDSDKLYKDLSKIKGLGIEFTDAKEDIEKSPPVKLKNCFLAKPFEFYTEMYGVPKYNEIDPSLFIALTYIIIFGIMFADIGQGICLSIVGLLMYKLKKMKIGKILFPCGISSAFFGLVFGSVFGFEHLLDPMYKALFGLEEKPFEVMASENTNTIIFAAIGIGVFLLIIAMLLNVYTSIRQKNYGRALFSTSGVAGIVFYGSTVFGLVGQMFLGMNILTLPYIIGLIVIPFLFVFFAEPLTKLVNGKADWQPESWGGYIVENLFESIEVILSYVTNTMSFLRVGAFVLVHAGMMMVVFVLAETVGGIGYWPVVILGNVLVMCLEALLVAIQVLRLEYYEMFSRFYSGEGRAYEPIKLNVE